MHDKKYAYIIHMHIINKKTEEIRFFVNCDNVIFAGHCWPEKNCAGRMRVQRVRGGCGYNLCGHDLEARAGLHLILLYIIDQTVHDQHVHVS